MLTLKKIKQVFNEGTPQEKEIFADFNLHIKDGDFVTIIGSNGAGKSTLMNIIIGNLIPDNGTVTMDKEDITNLAGYKRAKMISTVFQNPTFGTAPSMTIKENLAMAENKGEKFGLTFALKRSKEEKYRELVKELGLGLENQMDTPVGLLSGGQRQSLSLIMSTMVQPRLLLLDEHTAALDPKTSIMVMNKTKSIVEKNRITTLMITHNLQDAIDYGNRLIMLHKGEIILDVSGDDKKKLTIEELLHVFHEKDNHSVSDSMLFN